MQDGDDRRADSAWMRFTRDRKNFWSAVAERGASHGAFARAYHRRMAEVFGFRVPPGASVAEIGCAEGDLLAALKPSRGVGVDFSEPMARLARMRHPELDVRCMDAHDLSSLNETFDVVLLSDLINDAWDVQTVFEQVRRLCTPRTRLLVSFHSRLWWLGLGVARRLGLARRVLQQNWLTREDVSNLLDLAGFEVLSSSVEVLLPLRIPLLERLCNRWLVRVWPFRQLGLTHVLCARLRSGKPVDPPLVSVIVPARNEAGNIDAILQRVPEMGRGTEIVFVEGHSSDGTCEAIETGMREHPERRCLFFQQTGRGKGDAVRLGFERASGEVLMILDADLTVPPELLPRFLEVLVNGSAEFVNGVRLVYPMEDRAMRFFNQLGNKFFSLAFSWLLGRPIKDTLCGTKVMWKPDYERIAANRSYFGDFDPFGDFDLLFGAARLNMKIVDLPVRYRERTYGTTNIQRWKHGWLLLRMVAFAARRIKFV